MQKKKLKKPLTLTIGKKKHKIKGIEFASDKKISKHGELAYEFVRKIFGVKGALLSDMSSVYDFDFTIDFEKNAVQHATEKILKKIKRIYGVDVSDIKGLLIYKILDRIVKVDHA
jgi:hypothetical protein